MIQLLLFPSGRSDISKAEHLKMGWEDLVEIFSQHEIVEGHKTYAPQYIPAIPSDLSKATGKDASCVEAISFYVLDGDKITTQKRDEILAQIKSENLDAFYHTTHSNVSHFEAGDGLCCFRILIRLSRPVGPREWDLFWGNARIHFGKIADETCSKIGKPYLVPSAPKESPFNEVQVFHGNALDVDKLLSLGGSSEDVAELVEVKLSNQRQIDAKHILRFVKNLKRSPQKQEIALVMGSALQGEPYAVRGRRENVLYRMAVTLADEWPDGSLQSLVEPFEDSINITREHDGPTVDDFRKKILSHQQRIATKQIEKELAKARQEARKQTNALMPISKEGVENFIKETGCGSSLLQFANRLVVQYKSTFFLFTGDDYEETSKDELFPKCYKFLQGRAKDFDFDLFYPASGDSPPSEKKTSHLVRDHGEVAKEVRYHYGRTYFEEGSRIFWRGIKKPHLRARWHPEVDEWVRTSFPKHVDDMLGWMAQAPNVDQPLAAIALLGAHGIGKSKFAYCIAKLWGAPPVRMGLALDNFNFDLTQCPVVFADEQLPRISGRVPTEEIRSMISSGVHDVNQKGIPRGKLYGYLRNVIAANSEEGISLGKVFHTKNDAYAVSRRFLVVECPEEREEAARNLFVKNHDLFLEKSAIAEHCLWLNQNHERKDVRFGITTSSFNTILTADEGADAVLSWIYQRLIKKFPNAPETIRKELPPVFVCKEKVYVHLKGMVAEWSEYVIDKRKHDYNFRILRRAIEAVSVREVRVSISDKYNRYWQINVELFREYVEKSGLDDEERIDALLKIPYELYYTSEHMQITEEERQVRAFCMKRLKGTEAA